MSLRVLKLFNANLLSISFKTRKGLEFVAAEDIKKTLILHKIVNDDLATTTFTYEPRTGRVHLFCQTDSIATLKSQLSATPLFSIYSMTLIASESVIPPEIFNDDNEQSTHDFVARQTSVAPWYTVIPEQSTLDEQQQHLQQEYVCEMKEPITFRATFKKGSIKHKARSQEMAGYVGFAFSSFFKHWKAKMTGFDYEIMAVWIRTKDQHILNRLQQGRSEDQLKVEEDSVILMLGVTIPTQHDQKQRNRVFVGQTSLNPCIAYCLTLISNPQPGQIILDMCCGTGTIPIEGASNFSDVLWVGSEVKHKTLTQKALGNVQYCNLKNVELLLGDGRKLCLRDNTVDSVISDWPWGLRENSFTQIQKLYPKFLKEMWRIVNKDGRAYIVTQGRKLMNRTLDYDWCQKLWSVHKVIPIGIGGYEVYLYILMKKAAVPSAQTSPLMNSLS
ncbi:putative RNA methylase family UPF0020-domain-containing protein [Mycotypha africana]|uniref:putative RNA methylase family UPF0020-domain-containing protein n=1 Tax=Mycotypha africana TaxID=64632 RepID=UPI00230002DE|nr:putative RNA methylase family UPF0020-domain-containing protein [Mycotypha africana]KAI8969042.1 putative RNA methylase family UPF0020-domain-containing protein [Mycotypha africana]